MLKFQRVLSSTKSSPYDDISWSKKNIMIVNKVGEVLYECPNAEFPADWSDGACQIVASKYFRESRNHNEKETSVRQMVERVVSTIVFEGLEQKYFSEAQAKTFGDELRAIILNQMASFNSPVWFNLGVPGVEKPQCSACFINSVEDSMESILDLAKTEGLIFKEGSGSGVNFSSLRSSKESIRGGGTASGPVSFMQGYDAFAGVILSGGRTRRAARMCILNVDHPDIFQFIQCKSHQESIVQILAESGMSTNFEDEINAYNVVKHQSGNNSVRVTDQFMDLVKDILHGYSDDKEWELMPRNPNLINLPETTSAKDLFYEMAKAAHTCGDPGIQFHDTINKYNTCVNDGEIHASNPCSEFMWLNDSACNLASVNLDKFAEPNHAFNAKLFKHVINIVIIAQDILIEASSYPTERIEKNSHQYRPLGLGFANLGGLLMSWGIPYDSERGRNVAASIASLLTGQAYLTSIELAQTKGTFDRYEANQDPMEDVLDLHYANTKALNKDIAGISSKAVSVWQDVMGVGFGRRRSVEAAAGFRNAQVTLIAPTGTIAFMMDCATTGIEPDIGLRKIKTLIGGSTMEYINPNIPKALKHLGYSEDEEEKLVKYVEENGHFEESLLRKEHLPVFDCSLPVRSRKIDIDGHINMVAAVQPFLSGAISKTFNMGHDATVEQVQRVFLRAWERKLKCITVYRHGSKMSEPLRVKEVQEKESTPHVPIRTRLPDDRDSKTHKFHIANSSGFIHVGFAPGTKIIREVFVDMGQAGNTIGGLMASCSKLFSVGLQYEIPIEALIKLIEGTKFPPSGFTLNPDIPSVGSPLDYLAKFLRTRYLNQKIEDAPNSMVSIHPEAYNGESVDINEDACPQCGAIMVRTGTCTICRNCSYSDGVCG